MDLIDRTSRRVENLRKFVPIGISTLMPSDGLTFDIYTRRQNGLGCELLLRAGLPLERRTIADLIERKVMALYLRQEEHPLYEAYLRNLLETDNDLPARDRYIMLREATMTVFCTVFSGGHVAEIVRAVDGIAEQLVKTLGSGHVLMGELFTMMAHDYTTYAHANNVSTYCVAIANALGIRSRRELSQIAAGGLLHDLGKRRLSPAVLKKKDLLTDDERRQVRRHAQWGFEELCSSPELAWGELMMVYQHHERIDGTGYPVQVVGQEIHPWAKICAVAEVFDSMTSTQPFRKQRSIEDSLDYLQRYAGNWFDPEVVKCLEILISQR